MEIEVRRTGSAARRVETPCPTARPVPGNRLADMMAICPAIEPVVLAAAIAPAEPTEAVAEGIVSEIEAYPRGAVRAHEAMPSAEDQVAGAAVRHEPVAREAVPAWVLAVEGLVVAAGGGGR